MKRLLLLTAALTLLVLPATAFADTFTFNTPAGGTAGNTQWWTDNVDESDYAGGANQVDLDHTKYYTWRIDSGLSIPAGHTITAASICFKNIANWDTNTNKLFVHLLNTANGSGIRSAIDNADDQTINNRFDDATNGLGPNFGVDNIKLFEKSFDKVGQNGYIAQNYTYNFTAAQLASLATFIGAGGNIAFGFDPDCHFWNNGISFTYQTAPGVPEPMSMILLGTGLAGLYVRRRRQRQ